MTMQQRLELVLPYTAALVAAALPAYLLRFSIFGIPSTALEILIYIFILLTVITRWGKFRIPPMHIRWIILLFVMAAVVSTIIAPDQRAALGILKAWILDPLLFAWALWQIPDQRTTSGAVIAGLVAGALLVSSVAIAQHLIGQVTVDGRVIGPYTWFPAENASPNYLALYLAPIGVLAAGIGIGSLAANRRRGLLGLLAAAIIVLAIYFSFSRAGLAAFALGTGSVLVMRSWPWIRARPWAKLTLLCLITLSLIAGLYAIRPDPSLSPEEGGRITASNNVRWEIWKTTGEILQISNDQYQMPNWVLGLGLGNYQNYFTELTQGRINYDRIAPLALTPHNFFLALWLNLGLFGFLAVAALLFTLFRAGLASVVTKPYSKFDNMYHWLVASLLGAMVALLAHGLLDTPYFKNDLSLLFWTLAILLLLLTEEEGKKGASQ